VLEVRGLEATYDGLVALTDVTLTVAGEEIVALVGANGAGKSTLLRCISGLHRPRSGTVRWKGEDLLTRPPHAVVEGGIAQVPEGRHLFPEMSVQENLELGAYRRRARADRRAQLGALWDLFPRLAERRRQRAGSLSGGEQQMLAIGRALMSKPRLLMLDEPSLGLAPRVIEGIVEAMLALQRSGLALLLVEQNVRTALALAGRAYVLERGRVVREGPGRVLLDDPEVRRAYLGPLASFDDGARLAVAPSADARARTGAAPGTAPPSLLEGRAVGKHFGGLRVLDGVSFRVDAGEIVALIGPNGAGKTTLFNVIGGLARPTSGVIRLHGEDITRLSPHAITRRGVGRTFQTPRPFPDLTVEDNVRAAARFGQGLGEVGALLTLVELDGARRTPARQLSAARRRLLELAMAMALGPRLFLVDEILGGLLPAEAERVTAILRTIRAEHRTALFWIDHVVWAVAQSADRVIVLHHGELICEGEPRAVLRDARVIEAYLGPTAARA
jgi:ABC-type branched-subunit amino acid transport system ATPase component